MILRYVRLLVCLPPPLWKKAVSGPLYARLQFHHLQDHFHLHPGLYIVVLATRARDREFSLATAKSLVTFTETKRKAEPKELPSCSVPQLQIAYTQQFEILVRALPELKQTIKS